MIYAVFLFDKEISWWFAQYISIKNMQEKQYSYILIILLILHD